MTVEGGPPLISGLRVLAGELHYHDNRYPLAPGTAENVDEEARHAGRRVIGGERVRRRAYQPKPRRHLG